MKTLLFFYLGASIASFLTLIAERFPETSIIGPRSYCNNCHTTLRFYDMIPILSQALYRFKCHYCQSKIPKYYMVTECLLGFLLLAWQWEWLNFSQVYLLSFSLLLSICDAKTHSYPFIFWVIGSLGFSCFHPMTPLFLFFCGLAFLCEKYDLKIGSGDFLYLATLSLTLDLSHILWVIQISSLLGILFILLRNQKKKMVAFIPFLSLAYVIITLVETIS